MLKPSLELIEIKTDTEPLVGLLYRPPEDLIDPKARQRCAVLFHGNTMNFYSGVLRFLPPRLVSMGYTCLAFNRRGHDILTTRNSRNPEGGAFQSTAQAIEDNELAVAYLRSLNLPAPVVIGHSNGGMLAVEFVSRHPKTPGMVLLSAHRGGEGLLPDASSSGLLACDQLQSITEKAASLVEAGKGQTLIQLPGWWWVISAQSFLDLTKTLPDTLALAPSIQCPTLFLVGDSEPTSRYPAQAFARKTQGSCTVTVIEDCDHFYNDREAQVSDEVCRWLKDTLDA
jgi:pimeloyl-ACP methyl ester carboxylesterase